MSSQRLFCEYISSRELTCFQIVGYVLSSHPSIGDREIAYACNVITTYYSSGRLDDHLLALFLVHSNTGIGRLAFTFNEILDSALIRRDIEDLKSLLDNIALSFPEAYDNPYLLEQDRKFISRLVSQEKEVFMMALELLTQDDTFKQGTRGTEINRNKIEEIMHQCRNKRHQLGQKSYQENKSRSGEGYIHLSQKCNSLSKECMSQSVEDSPYRRKKYGPHSHPNGIYSILSYETIPSRVFTVDNGPNHSSMKGYCFDFLDLISEMTKPVPINYYLGAPFSNYSQMLIKQRFRKEIAMYLRYKEGHQYTSNIRPLL